MRRLPWPVHVLIAVAALALGIFLIDSLLPIGSHHAYKAIGGYLVLLVPVLAFLFLVAPITAVIGAFRALSVERAEGRFRLFLTLPVPPWQVAAARQLRSSALPLAVLVGYAVLGLLVLALVRLCSPWVRPGHHPTRSLRGLAVWTTFRVLDEARTWLFPIYSAAITPLTRPRTRVVCTTATAGSTGGEGGADGGRLGARVAAMAASLTAACRTSNPSVSA